MEPPKVAVLCPGLGAPDPEKYNWGGMTIEGNSAALFVQCTHTFSMNSACRNERRALVR
jgi:hypothetical protein